jgi:hypothetical protein
MVNTVLFVSGPLELQKLVVSTGPESAEEGTEEILHEETLAEVQVSMALAPVATEALCVEPFTLRCTVGAVSVEEVMRLIG